MVQTVTHEARTSGQGDLRDLTEVVAAAVSGSGLSAGIVTVAVVGSTAGVTTIEFEPGAVADFGAMCGTSSVWLHATERTCTMSDGATTTGRVTCAPPCSDRR